MGKAIKVWDGTQWVYAGGGSGGSGASLPDQTGNSGKFLTTDGSIVSWSIVNSLPSQTGQTGKFLTTDGTDASWAVVTSGGAGVAFQPTQPTTPSVGDLWVDSDGFIPSGGSGGSSVGGDLYLSENYF